MSVFREVRNYAVNNTTVCDVGDLKEEYLLVTTITVFGCCLWKNQTSLHQFSSVCSTRGRKLQHTHVFSCRLF